jgi:hypothetical protein
MVDLTKEQALLLYDVTERHLDWYKIYYSTPPLFEVLLELNHRKLSYRVTNNMKEKDITNLLKKMWQSYDDLITYYSTDE